MAIFRREPPSPSTGTSNAGVVGRNRDSEPISAVKGSSGKCTTTYIAATDHGELMALVAGKRRSLLMAGDDDKVYDKKPQSYAEDNVT